MSKIKSNTEKILDLYSTNDDYAGYRDVENQREHTDYHDNSIVRIWYNTQTSNFESHWHNAMEIIMPIENHYDVASCGQNYHLIPGDILVIPPTVLHELIAPDSGERFIYLLDISLISKLKGFASIETTMTHPIYITRELYPAVYDSVVNLLSQMRDEYFGKTAYSELSIYALLTTFFVIMGRNRLQEEDVFPNTHSYKQTEYIQKLNDLMDYVEYHYMDDLTLDFAANFVGFSKYHFSRLFKQYIGCTFCDYLVQKRIGTAEKLLDDPTASITEVFLQTGFQSLSTFNRLFKQRTGYTPSQYRQKHNSIEFTSSHLQSLM